MDLSIIIPVYNEGRKVDTDIRMAAHFLEEKNISGEIIISDDGSTDDTIKIPDKILSQIKVPVKIIENKTHYGKGHAVRSGILNAIGNILLFIDSGACIPYVDILPGIEMLRERTCEIAHGSRFLPGSFITLKKQWYRRVLSYSFRKLIPLLLKIPYGLTDTQCGLKIYKKEVAHELYRPVITRGFMFDIEVIRRAEKAGYLIKEFPITWTADLDSRLPIVDTFLNIFYELKRIRDLRLN
jgi:dolichyl-phosphate beta-glucosyltransferase